MANELAKLYVVIGANTKDLERGMKRTQKALKEFGMGLAVIGGAMTASMAVAVKAAAEGEAGIRRLDVAMKNVGISYQENKEQLNDWMETQMRATAFSSGDQRDALTQLVMLTKDLGQAQQMLRLAMDVSIGTGQDLSSITEKIGQAMAGNWGSLERYIPALREAKTEEEKWYLLRQAFTGQAEAFGKSTGGQLQILKNNVDDLKESMGGFIAQGLQPYINSLNQWLQRLKQLNPETQQQIANIGVGVAGTATITGGFAMMLSQLPNVIKGYQTLVKLLSTPLGMVGGGLLGAGMVVGGVMGLVFNDKSAAADEQRKQLYNQIKNWTGEKPEDMPDEIWSYSRQKGIIRHQEDLIREYAKMLKEHAAAGYIFLTEEVNNYIEAVEDGSFFAKKTIDTLTDSLEEQITKVKDLTWSYTNMFKAVTSMGSRLGMSGAQAQLLDVGPEWVLTAAQRATFGYIKNALGMGVALDWYKQQTGMSLWDYVAAHFPEGVPQGMMDQYYGSYGPGSTGNINISINIDGNEFANAIVDPLGQQVLAAQGMGG